MDLVFIISLKIATCYLEILLIMNSTILTNLSHNRTQSSILITIILL